MNVQRVACEEKYEPPHVGCYEDLDGILQKNAVAGATAFFVS
jgi:hypothetical protein